MTIKVKAEVVRTVYSFVRCIRFSSRPKQGPYTNPVFPFDRPLFLPVFPFALCALVEVESSELEEELTLSLSSFSAARVYKNTHTRARTALTRACYRKPVNTLSLLRLRPYAETLMK